MKKIELDIIGWREWINLKSLGVSKVKAKVDSGAKTSSLHAFDVKSYTRNSQDFVKFYIHPEQRTSKNEKLCHAKVLEYRKVKSSNGQVEKRPVILVNNKIFIGNSKSVIEMAKKLGCEIMVMTGPMAPDWRKFDKANPDAALPSQTWTPDPFGKKMQKTKMDTILI